VEKLARRPDRREIVKVQSRLLGKTPRVTGHKDGTPTTGGVTPVLKAVHGIRKNRVSCDILIHDAASRYKDDAPKASLTTARLRIAFSEI
jgi:hypothetical protein